MKKNYFWNSQKFAIREIRKIPHEDLFFPRQAIPITFWHYTLITLLILNAEFGLIWTTPWPHEKKAIFKIPFSRNSKSSIWKPNLFPSQAKRKIFFALHCHYNGDTPYPVWFDLDNSLTRWKNLFLKFPFSRNSKKSVWKPNFSHRQAK